MSADIRRILQAAVTAAAAVIALGASRVPTQAQSSHMLVIPASDGYGFDDCLASNKACGQTIADAWCEAHGMTAAASFGRSDDITASIPSARQVASPQVAATKVANSKLSATKVAAVRIDAGSFIVNCRD